MSKNRIVLFGVLGVVVGLALGVFGRDFIVANEAQEHSNEVPIVVPMSRTKKRGKRV